MSQHTPGPWTVTKDARVFSTSRLEWNRTLNAETPEFVAACASNQANARLIAKAPEMKDLITRIFVNDRHFDTCDFVKFDTACYACNCGNAEARALLREIEKEDA